MTIPDGTPVRLTHPKASVNANNPHDCPTHAEGTVGALYGPLEDSRGTWRRLIVTYEIAVREEDIEPIPVDDPDGEEEGR